MNIAHMNAGDLAQMMGHGATEKQAELMRAELIAAGHSYSLAAGVPKTVWAKCLARVPLGTATAQNFKFRPDRRDPDDPTTTRTNGDRAICAEEAVQVACIARGESDTPDYSNVTDLLADLGHLCDREGWDFPTLIDSAVMNWRAER